MPRSRSCWASSRSVGPARPARSSVGSPPSWSAQLPTHLPLTESRRPSAITRVVKRAPPPILVREKPVVKSLVVDAGIRSSSGLTLHNTRPSIAPMLMPHWPPGVRSAVRRIPVLQLRPLPHRELLRRDGSAGNPAQARHDHPHSVQATEHAGSLGKGDGGAAGLQRQLGKRQATGQAIARQRNGRICGAPGSGVLRDRRARG